MGKEGTWEANEPEAAQEERSESVLCINQNLLLSFSAKAPNLRSHREFSNQLDFAVERLGQLTLDSKRDHKKINIL